MKNGCFRSLIRAIKLNMDSEKLQSFAFAAIANLLEDAPASTLAAATKSGLRAVLKSCGDLDFNKSSTNRHRFLRIESYLQQKPFPSPSTSRSSSKTKKRARSRPSSNLRKGSQSGATSFFSSHLSGAVPPSSTASDGQSSEDNIYQQSDSEETDSDRGATGREKGKRRRMFRQSSGALGPPPKEDFATLSFWLRQRENQVCLRESEVATHFKQIMLLASRLSFNFVYFRSFMPFFFRSIVFLSAKRYLQSGRLSLCYGCRS